MGGMAGTDEPIDGELVDDTTATSAANSAALDEPLPQAPPGDYDQAGVPSFDYVRDRIENRVATSVGTQELAGETPEGKAVEDQFEARERAGRDKLEEIRRQLRGEK